MEIDANPRNIYSSRGWQGEGKRRRRKRMRFLGAVKLWKLLSKCLGRNKEVNVVIDLEKYFF